MPCFRGQSISNFSWLVFFDDAATPEWLRQEVKLVSQGLFEPVFVPGEFTKEFLSETASSHCSTPYVITTRVDNDDAIAYDFIEQIQACFSEQDLTFVNFVNGAQFADGKTYVRPYTKNPFSSLIENILDRQPLTVLAEHHYRIDELAPVLNIRTPHPMWLQVIHGSNVLNEVVGLRVPGQKIARFFPCDLMVRDSGASIAFDQTLGSVRIVLRLLRKPHRLVELYRSLRARKAAREPGGLALIHRSRVGPG